jgi:hypothetical protein
MTTERDSRANCAASSAVLKTCSSVISHQHPIAAPGGFDGVWAFVCRLRPIRAGVEPRWTQHFDQPLSVVSPLCGVQPGRLYSGVARPVSIRTEGRCSFGGAAPRFSSEPFRPLAESPRMNLPNAGSCLPVVKRPGLEVDDPEEVS